MRDIKAITGYASKLFREAKEKMLHRTLRTEVEIGKHGTQQYVIKKGANKGKIAGKKI